MKNDPETRLNELERLAAEQERVIEDLSGEIAEQWKVIESLRKKMAMLLDSFSALEDRVASDVPNTRPPHW